jgi:hypothetical protein
MRQASRHHWILAVTLVAVVAASCSSVWRRQHDGVRYTIHTDPRSHRIEREKEGRLMYDSPELTVVCENGRLVINGKDCGAVHKGDHVEVTDLGTVLVNGERRGDTQTGQRENDQRIHKTKAFIKEHISD